MNHVFKRTKTIFLGVLTITSLFNFVANAQNEQKESITSVLMSENLQTDPSGNLLLLNQANAILHCSKLGKRLPSITEFSEYVLENGGTRAMPHEYDKDLAKYLDFSDTPDMYQTFTFEEEMEIIDRNTKRNIFELHSTSKATFKDEHGMYRWVMWLNRSQFKSPILDVIKDKTIWTSSIYDHYFVSETGGTTQRHNYAVNLVTAKVDVRSWVQIRRPFICIE